LALLAAPAAAQAEPGWQRFPDPPGSNAPEWDGGPSSVSMSLVGATPYVSWAAPDGLTVWRLSGSPTRWVQVGGRLDDPSSTGRTTASLVSDGSTLWAAWSERSNGPDGPTNDVHVARLVDGQFEPVAAGRANGANATGYTGPQTGVLGGRLYVAFGERVGTTRMVRIVRYAADGSSYEAVVNGLVDDGRSDQGAELRTVGGRLYLSYQPSDGDPEWQLARLNAAGTTWENLLAADRPLYDMTDHDGHLHLIDQSHVSRWTDDGGLEQLGGNPFDDASPGPIASAGGVLYAAGNLPSTGPGLSSPSRLAAFDGSAWQPLALPFDQDKYSSLSLHGGSDGGLWTMYLVPADGISSEGAFYPHLARYGEPPAPGVDEPDAPPASPPAPGAGSGSGSGGFTHPGGDPAPAPHGPGPGQPHRRGACATTMRGTPARDRIVGRALGERILGRGGADHLFGGSGRDCISGDAGDDFVSGGPAADALSGGRGDDRLVTGGGRDDVAAGSGDDTIHAVGGGVDRVNCGAGFDTVRLSRNDLIKGCERVIVRR
jgi:hypothetical protein